MSPTAIVAYLAFFVSVGFLFVLVSLLLDKLLRAAVPTRQKLQTYECGEQTVGPSSVQFDLRFYVVALLFLIFEVEVAFFFPPAVIFGRAAHRIAERPAAERTVIDTSVILSEAKDHGGESRCLQESVVREGDILRCAQDDGQEDSYVTASSAPTLALASMLDLGLFFAVLLVGFAYIWRCGDLDWVRAVAGKSPGAP